MRVHLQEASSHHFHFSASLTEEGQRVVFFMLFCFLNRRSLSVVAAQQSVLSPDKVKDQEDRGKHVSGR